MQSIQEDLKQFLLNEDQVEEIRKAQARGGRQHNRFVPLFRVPNLMYYFKGLAYTQVMLILIGIFSQIKIDYDHVMKYVAYSILTLSSVAILYWVIQGLRRKFIQRYWAVYWTSYALCLAASCFLLQFTQSGLACLQLVAARLFFIAVGQLVIHRTLYRLWISLFIDLPIISILVQFVKRTDSTQPIIVEPEIFNNFVIFCVIALIIMVVFTARNQGKWDHAETMFMLSLWYLLFIGIAACIIVFTSYYFSYPWPVITIINHIIFTGICVYLTSILPPNYKFCKCGSIFAGKNNKAEDQSKQMLYQLSRGLLCQEQDHIECSRESVINKSLDQCVCCMSQQSSFCYDKCKHVCVGLNCAAQWLQKNVRKCPVCRAESQILIRVTRKDKFVFQIVARYAFKGIQIN